MAFAYVATENVGIDGNSLTVNKPTGTADDDIMFATVSHFIGYSDSVPSGRTSLGKGAGNTGYYTFELFYKKASSEGSTYTRGFANSSRSRVVVSTFRGGFDTTTPIDVTSNTDYTMSNDICRAVDMTVTATNSPLIFFGCMYGNIETFTKPSVPTSDWTEHFDGGDTNSYMCNEVCSMIWTGSGATGDMDATMSGTYQNKHGFAVALKPTGGSVANTTNFFNFF